MGLKNLIFVLFLLQVSNFLINAQITTPCSPVMISSVTPCLNFLTNSSGSGSSPTADCCDALHSLTISGVDCLCLILTASVPFTIPINRAFAISLPRACNMPGVPVQCNPSASPLPAPGPASLGLSPPASPSPKALVVPEPAEAPEPDIMPLLPPPSPRGSRPVLTPSAAFHSSSSSLSLLLFAVGLALLKYY